MTAQGQIGGGGASAVACTQYSDLLNGHGNL
jgi:hypothetical protein